MDATSLIIGVGVVSALLFFFTFNLELKQHFILRLFLVFFALGLLLLVPKVIIDEQYECETVVANSTILSNETTSYEYESFCFERTETTPVTFYKMMMWFYRIFIGYIIVYLFVLLVTRMVESRKRGKI